MNIKDFDAPPPPATWDETLAAIFARQYELMMKYKTIEQLPDPPVPLHHQHGQRIIKDFAWRVTEELTESFEAWQKHGDDYEVAQLHALEELADAMHFFVELCLFAGVTVEQCLNHMQHAYPPVAQSGTVHAGERHSAVAYWTVVYQLGIAMNFLKNKAWKTSHVPTDEGRFREALLIAFASLVQLWASLGYEMQDLHAFYFRKSEVNKFRQRSAY